MITISPPITTRGVFYYLFKDFRVPMAITPADWPESIAVLHIALRRYVRYAGPLQPISPFALHVFSPSWINLLAGCDLKRLKSTLGEQIKREVKTLKETT